MFWPFKIFAGVTLAALAVAVAALACYAWCINSWADAATGTRAKPWW